ncbi:RNA-guided endonuclease TnpB family protein [Vulcanisaeta sp. JCM 16161]|uniref:zinc ribbon domain-containing protein n=1 Tax=Vulcanisaeta sp. JCM 16161 TaxID=1295372 RepID=UPI0006CF5BF6|nr:zinc ribbon domain-containing protein [Vulcanisaeta sp. JCM 16161]
MAAGGEGVLTFTVRIRVSPEPAVIDLLKRYRTALNMAIRVLIANNATSISKAHALLYDWLKSTFNLPSRIAMDCYREALSIVKSWLRNPNKGKIPTVKTLRMWLTPNQGYRVNGDYVELIGGYRLRIIGRDPRYADAPNREARLVYRDGEMYLFITRQVPKPAKYEPKGVLAVDFNEHKIVFGNFKSHIEVPTPIRRALHYRRLAEELQRKYSKSNYLQWLRNGRILNRVRHFHRRARSIIEDWARRTAVRVVKHALVSNVLIVREDLNGLINALRRLPKSHRRNLIMLGYRRLAYWIDWEAMKHGVPVKAVNPRGSSTTCPICGGKLIKAGYRRLKCPACGFEGDRDVIAVMNLSKMGGALPTPTARPMTNDTTSEGGNRTAQ